ncbi:dehydrogenase/reductase SDR family member 7-like [Ixodes scapularis]
MAKDTEVILVPFDLSDFSCHERQLKAVVNHYGRVDILVNNAGRRAIEQFEDFTYEDDRAVFDVNVFAPVSLTRLTLKHSMQQQRRLHVVVNSSVTAMQAMAKDTEVILVPFDLSDFSCHERQLKAVVNHYGRVDILVNNAGRRAIEQFEDFTYEDDRAVFDVNVFAPVSLTRLTLKHSMQQQRRLHVVVNSSVTAMQGGRSCSVYAATKSALQGYFSSLRLQGRMTGAVDVTVVFPGPVLTPLLGDAEKLKKRIYYRMMSSERCAQLIAVAMANKVGEAWICDNPMLMSFYFCQYLPNIFQRFIACRLPWNRTARSTKNQ